MDEAERPKRLPRNYQLVYDVVSAFEVGEHAAAGEIYAAARSRQVGIGYSTVYRALDRLAQLGLVSEVRVPGSAAVLYEAARADHAHFRCDGCGSVFDLDYALPASDIAAVATARGLRIRNVDLTLSGVCEACSRRPEH